MSNIFLKTITRKEKGLKPIWIMRQAGRYLPEYKETRKQAGTFLDLCYNPKLATEVTLQPIRRFGFDASIIFSDILVIPHSLGINVEFQENVGPIVENIDLSYDLAKLKINADADNLQKVYEAVNLTRSKLEKNTALIGFSGCPWTLAAYLFADFGAKDKFEASKKFIFQNPGFTKQIIEILQEQILLYLIKKIEAGADVIKLFESWAGLLPEYEFREYVIKPAKYIIKKIKDKHPNIPIIAFPKGAGFLYDEYINEVNPDAIAIDQFVPLGKIQQWRNKIVTQGNMDPIILLSNKEKIEYTVDKIKETVQDSCHIFNLGHGILPSTPIENVQYFIDRIRS